MGFSGGNDCRLAGPYIGIFLIIYFLWRTLLNVTDLIFLSMFLMMVAAALAREGINHGEFGLPDWFRRLDYFGRNTHFNFIVDMCFVFPFCNFCMGKNYSCLLFCVMVSYIYWGGWLFWLFWLLLSGSLWADGFVGFLWFIFGVFSPVVRTISPCFSVPGGFLDPYNGQNCCRIFDDMVDIYADGLM